MSKKTLAITVTVIAVLLLVALAVTAHVVLGGGGLPIHHGPFGG